ncbi:aminoglycoside adenylyltransferase domain-containing protein [Paenibacillus hamazuiensis]|uniref:aminoglycoside adenylyltransferase domain-containing protein n=1 Tax=Paenibacillus hamazuiensis TaxID=2936508 RepID=UPI00200D8EA1|nr:aminoglycoside adenylyltransferase domain-containing protein [Paenibacillus hamazuiensis]
MNLSVAWNEQLVREMTAFLQKENTGSIAASVMKLVHLLYAVELGEDASAEEAVRYALQRLPERWHKLVGWADACCSGHGIDVGPGEFGAPLTADSHGICVQSVRDEAEAFARFAAGFIRQVYFC